LKITHDFHPLQFAHGFIQIRASLAFIIQVQTKQEIKHKSFRLLLIRTERSFIIKTYTQSIPLLNYDSFGHRPFIGIFVTILSNFHHKNTTPCF
jgi:hypothetical protein